MPATSLMKSSPANTLHTLGVSEKIFGRELANIFLQTTLLVCNISTVYRSPAIVFSNGL